MDEARDERGPVLLLHTGGAKTGTSALQNLLRAGTDRLASAGVTYAGARPLADPTEITSGNAPPLTHALRAGDGAEVGRLLDLFLGGRARGLASSETLESLGEPEWRRLIAAARARGVGLRVAHVVRDPLPLLLSVYDQKVKRHGEARDVAAFAEGHSLRVFGFLRTLHALAAEGAIGLAVRRYESVRGDLAGAVLGALGLDPGLLAGVAQGEVAVNRSLDRTERRILRRVNAAFGDRHSKALSDRFLAADPGRRAEPPDAGLPALVARLRERHGADIAWVNATLLPPGDGLALPDAEEGVGATIIPEPFKPHGPEGVALAWALETLEDGARAGAEAGPVLKHLRALLSAPRPADPRLPADFDPLGYLVLNPKLAERRVDPYQHYLRHGAEKGLRWRPEPRAGREPRAAGGLDGVPGADPRDQATAAGDGRREA